MNKWVAAVLIALFFALSIYSVFMGKKIRTLEIAPTPTIIDQKIPAK